MGVLSPWFVCSLLGLAPGSVAAEPDVQHVIGGEETAPCAWPSVVLLEFSAGVCSGVLVHPEIVLTVGHCVQLSPELPTVYFGENLDNLTVLAEAESCSFHPDLPEMGLNSGVDFGFCKLAEPVTDIPIVAIAQGCEETVLVVGTEVVQVGWGRETFDGTSGIKREVALPIDLVTTSGEIQTGFAGSGGCSGDSGGPLFVQLPASAGGDDTWRVAAIHSWTSNEQCDGARGAGIASRAVAFVEEESGIDISPCFTGDGTWAPTPACQGMPLDPGVEHEGDYDTGCAAGTVAGLSEVCGPAFADEDPPTVEIVSPSASTMLEPGPDDLAILDVEVIADDGDGSGLEIVEIVVDAIVGEAPSVEGKSIAPFEWAIALPVGAYWVHAVARDAAGLESETTPIGIGVGMPAPGDASTSDTGIADGSDGTGADEDGTTTADHDPDASSSTGSDADQSDGDDAGCGCTTGDRKDVALLVGWLLAMSSSRSRRRASARKAG